MKVYASKDYVEESISKHSSFGNGHLTFKNINGQLPEGYNSNWRHCAVGDGRCVLFSDRHNNYAYTDDGFNYKLASLVEDSYMNYNYTDVVYGNGNFVVLARSVLQGSGQYVYYSADGINWNISYIPTNHSVDCLIFGGGMFIAMRQSGLYAAEIYTSEDGVTWKKNDHGISGEKWDSIAFGNNVCVAVGASSHKDLGNGKNYHYFAYNDGLSSYWNLVSAPYKPDTSSTHKVVFGNGIFVESKDGKEFSYSYDGRSWTKVELSNPIDINLDSFTFCGGKFIGISNLDVVVSEDGIHWEIYNNCVPNSNIREIIYYNNLFIAFTNSTALYYSENLRTWTSQEKFLKQGDIDVTESFKEYLEIPTKDELISEVLAALPTWTGGSY